MNITQNINRAKAGVELIRAQIGDDLADRLNIELEHGILPISLFTVICDIIDKLPQAGE